MNEALICWVLLTASLCARFDTQAETKQKLLHQWLPRICFFCQWYTLCFGSLVFILFRTFSDIVKFEYIGYNFLQDEGAIQNKLTSIPNLAFGNSSLGVPITLQQKTEALAMPNFLRLLSLASPVAGVCAFVIITEHVVSLVKHAVGTKGSPLRWRLSRRHNNFLMVILMPLVFVVMSMRSTLRIWTVMTGSAWSAAEQAKGKQWKEVEREQISLFTTDLQIASAFQLLTVLSFVFICADYLHHAVKKLPNAADFQYTIRFAGFQGVYAYVLVGVAKFLVEIVVAIMDTQHDDQAAAKLQATFLGKVDIVNGFATALCIYNMVIVCMMRDIKDRLGNASLKFLATRVLLLLAQIQFLVIKAAVAEPPGPVYEISSRMHQPFDIIANWGLSLYQGRLLHSSLLGFECLAVVVFNRFAWPPSSFDQVFGGKLEDNEESCGMVTEDTAGSDYHRI